MLTLRSKLSKAVLSRNIEEAKNALSEGDTVNENGESALRFAIMFNDIELVKLLVERGGNVEIAMKMIDSNYKNSDIFNDSEVGIYLKMTERKRKIETLENENEL